MQAVPSVTTLTVSYESAALVIELIESLARERRAHTSFGLRSVIVDNASGDAPAIQAAVERGGHSSWVEVLTSDRNGGFAYGNNVALRHCYEGHAPPDYFMLLNPDTLVHEGAIRELVDFMQKTPRAGVAGSCLESREGKQWRYSFRFPSWSSEVNTALGLGRLSELLRRRLVVKEMGDAPGRADWLPGAALLVRRAVFEGLGGMDENYFLYFEETDFLKKASDAGWETWWVPTSHVVHVSGQSTKIGEVGRRTRRLPDYWYDSRRRYFEKNHGVAYALLTDLAVVCAMNLTTLRRRLFGRDSDLDAAGDILRHSRLFSRLEPGPRPREYRPRRAP